MTILLSEGIMDRGFLMMDKNLQRQSITRLAELKNISMLCTAHSGFSDTYEDAMQAWRTHNEN